VYLISGSAVAFPTIVVGDVAIFLLVFWGHAPISMLTLPIIPI